MIALLRRPIVAAALVSLLACHTQATSSDSRRLRGLSAVEAPATCETADSFCNVLSAGSTCVVTANNRGTCSGTTTPCHCVGKTGYNGNLLTTTTPAPQSSSAPSTPTNGCTDFPNQSVELTMWAEWPTLQSDNEWPGFFNNVLNYVNNNCGNLRTTNLVMRIMNPYFSFDGSSTAMFPTATSPLYTGLISKLPSTVQLHFYPYVMDAAAQAAWQQYGGATGQSNLVPSIYKFANDWNTFLSSVGAPLVKGIVIDNEEIRTLPNYAQILDPSTIQAVKGSLEFGITIGFDEIPRMRSLAPTVDRFYLQVYDLYTPVANVDQTGNSPFLKMQNDGASMAQFIVSQVIAPTIWEAYNELASQVTLMWSSQSSGKDCLYPLNNGTCGGNNEFGSWSPKAFNDFVVAFKAAATAANQSSAETLQHALFQFSFVPTEWVPASATASS